MLEISAKCLAKRFDGKKGYGTARGKLLTRLISPTGGLLVDRAPERLLFHAKAQIRTISGIKLGGLQRAF